jgi:oligopeptide transport system ATP-binding protein
MAREPLLSVEDLHVRFWTRRGTIHAVNGVSFDIAPGETLGIVGESGCGKSVTALSLLGILPRAGKVASGSALFDGRDLLQLSDRQLRKVRGKDIAMIFQDPMTSLNPVLTIGRQIAEALETHFGMSKRDAMKRSAELLDRVGIPSANKRVRDYPHQFSGGMRQRAMIAMALACRPKLMIADEPTTALDVTIQAQILDLLRELVAEGDAALILITHDLGVVADVADKISVMYAGRIVEKAQVGDIYARPAHPYTKGLLESIPRLDLKGKDLSAIRGLPPSLTRIPPGCEFNPRCPYAQQICRDERPPLNEVVPGRYSACHFAQEVLDGTI